jgi:hypothetical protein
MPRLLVNPGSPQQWEIPLKPGANTLGRSPACDAQVEHDSVSGTHCQIFVNGESVAVKDLGSTNGTFLNRAPIQEAVLAPGQRLQLGGVEMELIADPPRAAPTALRVTLASAPVAASVQAAAPAATNPPMAPPRVSLRVAAHEAPPPPPSVPASYVPDEYSVTPEGPAMCKYHPKSAARYLCPQCQLHYCELCVMSRPDGQRTGRFCRRCSSECVALNVQIVVPVDNYANFFSSIPGAFAYPFKGLTGIMFLVFGSVLFAIFEVFFGLSVVRGWHVKLFVLGYTFAFMQKIIHAGAQGTDDPPGWPDISEFVQDLLVPGLQLMGTFLVSFGPGIGLAAWVGFRVLDGEPPDPVFGMLIFPLIFAGMIYFPMGVLAVAMHDSVLAGNPLVVIPAMFKAPLEYFVVLLLAALVIGSRILGMFVFPLVIPVFALPNLLGMFLALYFLTVMMRLLGLMYYAKRDKLGWLRG